MRTDKALNIKKLKTELLKNPLQTEEQLWKKIGVDRCTVNRLKEEMHEIVTSAKDEAIIAITNTDREIIELSQFISRSKLKGMKESLEKWEDLDVRDLKQASDIAKESTARYSLFRWEITDKDWGMKDTKPTPEEAKHLLSLLWK